MTEQQEQPKEPTPEETQKISETMAAGAAATQAGEDPAAAMKAKRDEVQAPMSDAQIDEFVEKFWGKFETMIRESGMMDPPVERVQPPAETPPPPAPPAPSAAEEVPAVEAPAPKKRTAAQRFLGID